MVRVCVCVWGGGGRTECGLGAGGGVERAGGILSEQSLCCFTHNNHLSHLIVAGSKMRFSRFLFSYNYTGINAFLCSTCIIL